MFRLSLFRRRLLTAFAALALPTTSATAAETYPVKPITLVIPFQGGITEQVGRLYGTELEKILGVPVIVDVRPGAGGTVGAKHAAKAAADGYTLVVTDGLSQETARGEFDSFSRLEAITGIMSQPFLLYVKPDGEIKDFKGYVDFAKANPGKVSYGSVGPNTTAHIIGQALEKAAGVQFVHVPYRGGGAQALAVLSGEATSGYLTAAFFKPYFENNQLRPLAVVASQRNPVYPDVPTVTELGYPTLAPLFSWWGIFAPKGLPADVKQKLVESAKKLNDAGELTSFIRKSGGEVLEFGPEATEKHVRSDIEFWKKYLAEAPKG